MKTSNPQPAMSLAEAQQDMRTAYDGGASGMFASALVWIIAAGVAATSTPKNAVLALLIGGVFIFPISIVLSKLFGRSGKHAAHNPLAGLAMEGTFWMLMCIPIAYAISLYRIEWFFPAMLLVIGGRYLTFNTLYGNRLYWLVGGALGVAAYASLAMRFSPAASAFAGAAIEAAFAVWIMAQLRRKA